MNRIAMTVNTTTQGPSNQDPSYSFQYSAGGYPGHVDRTLNETADGFGHVRGSYSYVDPKTKVRVEYDVDENGHYFHPSHERNYGDAMNQPSGSEAVRRAAEAHNRIHYDQIAAHANFQPPQYTDSVQRERDRHFYLYNKIAAEHAAIGAQHQAQQAAIGAQHAAIGAQRQAQQAAIGAQRQAQQAAIGAQRQAQHAAIGAQHAAIGAQHQAQHAAIDAQYEAQRWARY